MRRSRRVRAGGALLVALALPAAAPTPAYRWTNVTVGAGGYAPNIVFSPVERGLAYLRTDMGGAYRWDAQAARWLPLQDDNAESSYMGIESIAPDPVDADVVYMAAGMNAGAPAAILRSADRGRHWTVTPVPFAMGGNEPGRGLGERLAIDPRDHDHLWFGSRHDGLWQSRDAGRHWAKVAGFPYAGLGRPARRTAHGGVSFVAIDPRLGARRIWAGIADPGVAPLYRSDDGGAHWRAVAAPGLLAAKGVIDARGVLWVGYGSGIGPSEVKTGALWRYDPVGTGRDVTPPDWRDAGAEGAFFGVAVARSAPGTVAVSTIDRYRAGDSLWLSRDDGAQWDDVGKRSRRDVSATPFLLHEGKGADFGHWISGLAIDPFDAGHIAYTTGATVYATQRVPARGPVDWAPWVRGIEQTAVITLIAPTGGAPVVSGFGDLAGFVHDDLDRSPQPSFIDPYLSNTNMLDYAGRAPNVIVRSGSLYLDRPRDASLARSEDGGRHWTPLRLPPQGEPPARDDLNGEAAITVSADGATMIVAARVPQRTRDGGRSWQAVRGLPPRTRAVADKVDAATFYAVDAAAGRLLVSHDGGASFAPVATQGLPRDLSAAAPRNRESQSALVAVPGAAGELWLQVGTALFHSRDAGRRFVAANGDLAVELFGIGKGAVYAIGSRGGVRGIWRANDAGGAWSRIDDDAHRWGGRYRVIAGDPRRAGRVYVGTDGRGLFYGDPAG
ncbi:hypothetical protein [Sphingomonas sp. RIT328]|uniref:hypothetical protein n=1 Tax=Sphingomonas sp. RIT328 TaxID=1470591 RepID=UPI0004468204|nr:hypothetical protein [Sphingomonas sp. RIT328]EZP55530.1 Xyloglucanase precursor [Sphingomonas sp. RIT328]